MEYEFNNLYFFDKNIIHDKINIEKILNEPSNKQLKSQILRSFFVISKIKKYDNIIKSIEKSKSTVFILKA